MNRQRLIRTVLVVCLAFGAAALLGSGARAVPLGPHLDATVGTQVGIDFASPATDSIAAGTTINGSLFWNFDIANDQSAPNPVSAPAISVTSGYDPSLFFPNGPPFSTSSFPFTVSQPSLAPQSDMYLSLGSSLPASTQVGCDTARSMSPPVVPPGGAQETITFTVRCVDPDVHRVQGGISLFSPCGNLDALCAGPTAFTFVSFTPPQNLDQGETAPAFLNQWNDATPHGSAFQRLELRDLITSKQYTFTLVVQMPNPYPVPIVWAPAIGMTLYATPPSTNCGGCGVPASSLTVPVSSLDGPTPNAGAVTLSTGEPHIWKLNIVNQRNINYGATDGGGLVYAGPTSAIAGQQVTVSTGWDPEGDLPLNGTPVTFTLGSQSCTGTTTNGGTPNAQDSCTMTLTQPVGSYTLKLFSPGDRSVYPESASVPFSITGPTTADQCKKGGWQVFGIFKNQGDCVSYVATGGKNPPG
jgi:hypothetical protein